MNKKYSTILFVIPTLGHGGAQKVMTEVLNHTINSIDRPSKCEVYLLTFRKENDPIHIPHPEIRLVHIDTINGESVSVVNTLAAPAKIRRKVKRINPDLIVSFQDIANFPIIMATIGLGIPVIVSERNDPRHYRMAGARSVLRKILYPLANKIVVQTQNIADQMPASTKKKLVLIPNAVPIAPEQATPAIPSNKLFTVVSAGRLEHQKDHVLLIEAFSILKTSNKNWRLKIYGEGSLRKSLEDKIKDLGLESLASIEPATANIYQALSKAHLFVLSSAHEGFPNILAEAVATGLPCIGFISVSGVPELIIDSTNGLLLTDAQRNEKDLALAMSELMQDSEKRKLMGENCHSIAINYKGENIYKTWMKLIFGN